MNDDSMVKIMQSLDLDYSKAISSTLQFQESIGSLNKQLESMKKIAMQSAKEINNAFSSQLGNVDTGFLKEYNKMFSNLEKQNKPIEIKVETDKAEIKMQKFAESMGIRLDKNLRGKFKGLASNLLGDFDQSQFDDLAANISMSYQKAMDKQNQKMQASMFAQSDDKKIYDYLNKATIKLDESTVRAKKNVDGFSHAIRNLAKQSETSGSSLDQMAQEMEGMGISGFGANTEDIAARMTKAVNSVRDFRNGMVDLGSSVPTAEIEQFTRDALSNLIVDLNKVQLESKEVTASLQGIGTSQESMESIGTITNSLKGEIKELGVVTTKTFKDMNNEAYKYIDTYKSLERGVSVSDTYIKNDQGSFDFQGRVVDDKSVELTYRNIQKAHTEALKLNAAFDQTIVKNQQLAQSDYWKSQFQNVSKTSDEIKALNNYYAKEEKQSAINMEKKHAEALKMNKARDAEIAKIKESNIEQMKAQAASVQQRTATKGLSEEYGRQASMLREQLAIIQNRLQTEGKLTAEEVRQTNQIKEQLNLLRSQTKAAISDDIREHPSTMGDEFARRTSWFLTGSIFYGAINSAKKATAAIKEVEGGITDISRVMNDSRFVFEEYRDELMKLGVDYGYTFETTQDVAMRWAQAGYNVVDSLELTETALAALNAAQLDSETATQGLIAIMSQWNIEATDLMGVIDKINITSDNYAVTSQDLVDGLVRSSGAARNLGLELEDTISLLTVMREASGRTGKEVGNALNTILSYMQRDTSISTFEDMGIEVFANTARTEFRNIMEVFEDLSKNWNTTSDTIKDGFIESADEAGLFSEEMAGALDLQEEWTGLQKRDASQAAAGVRRRNYFIALIDRFASSQEVLNGMMEAEGYTMEKNEIAMDTLEKKTESLKASAEALAVAIGDAGLTDALTAMADGGTSALNAINNLPPGMRDAVVATSTLFLGIKALEMGMKTFGIQLPGVSQMIVSLTSGTWSLTAALKAGTAGMIAFTKANAPLLLLTAVVGGIMAVRNAIKKSREEQEKAIQLFNEQKGTYAEVDKLVSSYEELASKSTLATEEQEKLLSIKEQIKNLLPESTTALDSENMSLKDQVAIIKDLNEEQLENLKLKALDVFSDGKNKYEDNLKELEKLKKSLEKYQKWIDHFALKKLDQGKLSFIDAKEFERFVDNANRARDEIKELTAEIEAHEEAEKILTAIYGDNIDALIDMTDETENLDNAQSKNQETMDNLTKAYDEATAVFDLQTSLQNMGSTTKQVFNELKTLDKVINDVRNGQSLSVDTILDLNEKYGLNLEAVEQTTEGYTIEISTLEDLRETKTKTALDGMEAERQLAENVKNQVASRLTNYGLEIEQLKNLTEARAIMAGQARIEAGNKAKEIASESIGGHPIVGNQLALYSKSYEKAYKQAYDKYIAGADADLAAYEKALGDLEAVDSRAKVLKGMLESGSSGSSGSGSSGRGSSASTREENTALNEALRLLEHKKKMQEETHVTVKEEVETLYKINELYVKTADERMDMAERIYAAEKNYLAKRLQHSVDWINTKKNFNELSIEEEIAAWERVRAKQSDNNEALKQAELNLYNLRSKVRADNYKEEESTINHLTKLGILSVEKQIKAYKKLYEVKAESLDDERSRVENLFGLYQKLFSEQQSEIKDAYEERISQIEDEKTAKIEQINTELEAKKNAQNEVIKGIERELELLNKEESEYDHDKKMADLREQLAYWQVRTSENARKKVIELNKQIDEAEYKRELQLKRDSLQDEKEIAQDKISNLDDKSREQVGLAEKTAKDEREKWEKSYKLTEKAFDEHGLNIIALAGTMSEKAYQEWLKNYIEPMRKALSSGDYDSFSSSVGKLDGSISGLEGSVTNTENAQAYRLANQILSYKRQYEVGGDKSAHERAKSVYGELSKLKPTIANSLRDMMYVDAKDYVAALPKMHSGGKSLSYGAVDMMPGELVFPPDLSIKLEGLIGALYQRPVNGSSSTSNTDNRKDVKIENLVRIDRNYMEDEVDSDMFAREIGRLVNRSF